MWITAYVAAAYITAAIIFVIALIISSDRTGWLNGLINVGIAPFMYPINILLSLLTAFLGGGIRDIGAFNIIKIVAIVFLTRYFFKKLESYSDLSSTNQERAQQFPPGNHPKLPPLA